MTLNTADSWDANALLQSISLNMPFQAYVYANQVSTVFFICVSERTENFHLFVFIRCQNIAVYTFSNHTCFIKKIIVVN